MPTQGQLTLSTTNGVIVLQQALNEGINTIDVSTFAAGVYVYTVETANETYRSVIVVK